MRVGQPPCLLTLVLQLVVVRGAAKLYVGELIELARTIMDERGTVPSCAPVFLSACATGETGAIRPSHVREAYHRMEAQGKVPGVESVAPRLFNARRSTF